VGEGYARGKTGVIVRDHGVYLFPDSNAHFQGEKRQLGRLP
jgi:nitrile hydratase